MKIKKYQIYHEKNRIKGNVAVQYIAYARDREEVLMLGEERGLFFDADGYTIEEEGYADTSFGRVPKIELIEQF